MQATARGRGRAVLQSFLLTSKVPQGLVTDPLLYLLEISGLEKIVDCERLQYADDTIFKLIENY